MPCQSSSLINCEFLELFSSRQIGVECLLCKKSRKLKQFILFFFFFLKLHFLTLEWEKLKDWTNPKTLCIDRSKLISSTEIEKKNLLISFFIYLFFFFNFGKPDILKILLYQVDQIQASFAPKSRGYLQIMAGKFKTLKNNNGKFPLNFFNDSIKHI